MEINIDKYVHNFEKIIEKTSLKALNFFPNLVFAIIIFLLGRWLIRFLISLIKKTFVRYEIEPSLATFLRSFIKFSLNILLIISIIALLGFPSTSLIAILSAAGLAIGLAIQGSLANFAGGVLILFFKPFKIGDIISSNGQEGTVKKIDILHTIMITYDNKVIVMPNGPLANNNLTNFTKEKIRRVDIRLGIAYESNIEHARKVILNVLAQDPRIHQEPAPIVVLNKLGDFSLDLIIRWWTDTEIYLEVYWENLEKIKNALDNEKIKIPFPQREINVNYTSIEKTI